MTNPTSSSILLTIDGKQYSVEFGLTILEAAQKNGIYIPTLCAFKGLSPYGGCRLCLVKIEGKPQFASACTTPISEGMIVHTNLPELHAVRKEMLSLILSEHPSVCFFCPENIHCDSNMNTLCKTEWVTGCHNCPQNGDCELQRVVAALGITQVKYSALTRSFDPETYDPFYDRDYNLCILCGRCIRACQEYRLAEVISFQHRGPYTKVGTAFDRSHLEAECEFCGSCVSVCPTGALAEKTRKWIGPADNEVQTTCPYCGLGCQIQLQVKGSEVIGSSPINHDQASLEQLCLKGRFAVYEVLNQPQRLDKPYLWENGIKHFLTPEEAVLLAAKKLSECPPDLFGLALSADSTNEELYIAYKLAHQALNSPNIENLSRFAYGNSFNYIIQYLSHQASWDKLENAQVIFSIGFDGRYNQSIVGSEIKQALQKGAVLITLNSNPHHLTRHAKIWINPSKGEEHAELQQLIALLKTNNPNSGSSALNEAAKILRSYPNRALLIGSQILHSHHSALIFKALDELKQLLSFDTFVFPLQANLVGSLWLQTFSEFQVNPHSHSNQGLKGDSNLPWIIKSTEHPQADDSQRFKVLLYNNTVPNAAFHQAEFTICQHFNEIENLPSPTLVLPAAAFAEMNGTLLDGFCAVKSINKATEPPGDALPSWQWLCKIAQQMGKNGFDFSSIEDIHRDIQNHLGKSFIPLKANSSASLSWQILLERFTAHPIVENMSFYPYTDENLYQGVPLRQWVGGLDDLYCAQEK